MLLIRCPWCGERDETEFHYGGQAHVPYPPDPDAASDEAWGEYLFARDNPRGPFAERWCHSLGCRRWFNAVRDTATHAVVDTYPTGERAPDRPEAGDRERGPDEPRPHRPASGDERGPLRP